MVPKVIHRPFLGRQGTWWMCWMLTGNQSPVEPAKVKAGIGPGWSAWLLPNYACKEETSWGLVSYETERPALDGLWICWSSHGILVIHAFTPTKAKYNFYPIILYVQILRRSLRFGKLRGLRWVRNSAYERKLLLSRQPSRRRHMFMATKADIIARRSCPSFTIEKMESSSRTHLLLWWTDNSNVELSSTNFHELPSWLGPK